MVIVGWVLSDFFAVAWKCFVKLISSRGAFHAVTYLYSAYISPLDYGHSGCSLVIYNKLFQEESGVVCLTWLKNPYQQTIKEGRIKCYELLIFFLDMNIMMRITNKIRE
jgi:hypothetical protein